jgi:carotenoid cleavage dioxygenase
MDGSLPPNPYLSGNFAPVADESDFRLEIVGDMPRDLAGAFYRNGPNPQFAPLGDYHWFTGDGMIHGVFVEDGQARYRNRYVRTPKWQVEHAAGRALFGGFDPRLTDPSVAGQDSGVANTNIVWHAGRLLALEEGHQPYEMDPKTLESVGYATEYAGRVTAHPKLDPETGEMVWFAYGVGETPLGPGMSYGVTDRAGKVVRRDDFQAPYASMVHDFLVTRRHVLFPVLPLTFSLERAMTGRPVVAWEADRPGYVGVMARDAGVETLVWYEVGSCYVFHPMNAWEEGRLIHADVMEYPVAPLFPNADGTMTARAKAVLTRWTIDLDDASRQIKRQALDDLAGEFPRFDERRAGLSYRHGWFAGNRRRPGGTGFDTIAHIDLKTGRRADFALPDGDFTSEPVFVPRHADAAEGEGWVVALIYRGAEDRSDFVVLDAQDVAAGPVALAKIPRRVPHGFHGNWRAA